MKNNFSHNNSLFQICWDKTYIEKFCHRLIKYSDSDWYVSKYSVSDKMIHEIINSVTILADRAAAVWENRDR